MIDFLLKAIFVGMEYDNAHCGFKLYFCDAK